MKFDSRGRLLPVVKKVRPLRKLLIRELEEEIKQKDELEEADVERI